MHRGGFPDTRSPASTARDRRQHALIALTVALAAAVVTAGALAASGVLPGRHPARVARSRPKAARSGPRRPSVGTIGAYRVARKSLLLLDKHRPANGIRRLPTLVRYPVVPPGQVAAGKVAAGPFPLVVFAPGYLQCRASYAALLSAWASAGYVVAAIDFPRTHCDVAVPDEADVSNQPADTSFVITRLLASSRGAGPLAGLIDPVRIAVAGHSDGGDTAAAVAANTCCRDRRVIAAIVLAGAEWPPLGGKYFPRGSPPVLFVQGTDDAWNPPPASVQLYRSDTTGIRYYLQLPGAGHFAPYEGHHRPEPVVARVTTAFLNRYVDGQRRQAAAIVRQGNVPGLAVLVARGHLPG